MHPAAVACGGEDEIQYNTVAEQQGAHRKQDQRYWTASRQEQGTRHYQSEEPLH